MTMMKFPTMIATSALVLVTACANQGGPNDNFKARNGAAIGAGLGVLAGIVTADSSKERRENTARGAVLGGLIGAGIGNALDRQEEELRVQMGGNVGIVNNGNNLVVTLPQDILFDTNSTSVSGASQADLFTLASSMNVVGHTDSVGDAAFNLDLSQRRAQAVTSVLINAGVAPQRLRSIGFGEDVAVASNQTAQGRQQNRRVEIIITPN